MLTSVVKRAASLIVSKITAKKTWTPLSSSLVMLCILGTPVVKSPKALLLRLILSRSEL